MSYFHYVSFKTLTELTSFLQTMRHQDTLLECGQPHRNELTLFFISQEKKSRPTMALDFFVTELTPQALLRAYHKQIHLPLQHGLLILESAQLSTLFAFILQRSQELEPHLLEVSRSTLPDGMACAVFVNLMRFDINTLPTGLTAAFYEKPNEQLMSLYNF